MAFVKDNIIIENARIGFRNFSGKEGPYNRAGDRNFAVFFEDRAQAQELYDIGWNVKNVDKEDRDPHLAVKVSFGHYPPIITLIQISGGKKKAIKIDEDNIKMLDSIKYDNIDMVIRPYNYEVRGTQGVSAYLEEMYITQKLSPLASKYADIDDEPFDEEDCPF